MKKSDSDFIIIGKLGAAYGVQGWLKVRAYTEFGANILEYLPWYINTSPLNDTFTPIKLESGRIHGNGIVAKLEGIDTPEKARLLTGKLIAITRSQLPVLKENEYYWSDLVGLTVINQKGEILGKVIYLIETGSNDVLVVKGEKEHAIPWIMNKVITGIDLQKQEIHVNWEFQ